MEKLKTPQTVSELKEYFVDITQRIWNNKEFELIDENFHFNAKIHSVLGDFKGPQGMRSVVNQWFKGFSKINIEVSKVSVGGDLISIFWKAETLHDGVFYQKNPTLKVVTYEGESTYRIEEGIIVEYWGFLDAQRLSQQIEKVDV